MSAQLTEGYPQSYINLTAVSEGESRLPVYEFPQPRNPGLLCPGKETGGHAW